MTTIRLRSSIIIKGIILDLILREMDSADSCVMN